jgi:hypothetical protein
MAEVRQDGQTAANAPDEAPVQLGPTLGPTAEWPAKAVDAIDLVVATVHDRAVRPAIMAARAVVFGLLIFVVSLVLLILLSVALVRILDTYVFDGRVWASYLLLGGLFVLAGLLIWWRRRAGAGEGGAAP